MDINCINIGWWNVNDFYHFRPEEVGNTNSRWPQSTNEFREKLDRVDGALRELCQIAGTPDVLFLGEVTADSARALRDRVFPSYVVRSLDVKRDKPTLQVAILHAPSSKNISFAEVAPIVVQGTPAGTRPMAVLDVCFNNNTLRIVGCHWQSRFDEIGSDQTRFRLADHLAMYSYDFLQKDPSLHHIAIVGDLNEEPFEHNLQTLHTHRYRARSRTVCHWTDHDVKRVHLYNTSWRLLGEKFPHSISAKSTVFDDCAGTYYWESKRSWHHFDHLIVSGGLLQNSAPYLDENELHIVSSPAFLTDGFPKKFSIKRGVYVGVSDHLPIVAKIRI